MEAERVAPPTGPGADIPVSRRTGADGHEEQPRSRLRAVRDAAGAALGTVMGIVPHVLHHIGVLAGAALVTGATGNLVFFLVGLLFSAPLLRRIHRRFKTPWAPALAVLVFAALFSLSAFVVGPALAGESPAPQVTTPVPSTGPDEHGAHHG